MARRYCPKCEYPASACVCASIRPIELASQLVVLQHPSEVSHAKNSVRLLQLVVPDTRVFVGESSADFAEARALLGAATRPVYLIYPGEQSQSVKQAGLAGEGIFVLLDGTWRKAYRMLQLNPWLLDFPALHLEPDTPSNYRIRKASRSDSLSTLEAAVLTLEAAEPGKDLSPITAAFDAMVELRLAAMPADVRARYR